LLQNEQYQTVVNWIKACFDHPFFTNFMAAEKEYLAAQQSEQQSA
jgi:hypothetical protein